eukprot:TRINITY_DN162_c0_g1_i2.p1 TRINITY_DN162_c0_g1~~TRINITY_DN162_c0_g1_i2.p1  ORF type:complete len:494 (+),score=121.10 TRINITY_DN162_c0_g1_i2:339-1820(+)
MSRGFGFVTFVEVKHADEAVRKHWLPYQGRRVEMKRAQGRGAFVAADPHPDPAWQSAPAPGSERPPVSSSQTAPAAAAVGPGGKNAAKAAASKLSSAAAPPAGAAAPPRESPAPAVTASAQAPSAPAVSPTAQAGSSIMLFDNGVQVQPSASAAAPLPGYPAAAPAQPSSFPTQSGPTSAYQMQQQRQQQQYSQPQSAVYGYPASSFPSGPPMPQMASGGNLWGASQAPLASSSSSTSSFFAQSTTPPQQQPYHYMASGWQPQTPPQQQQQQQQYASFPPSFGSALSPNFPSSLSSPPGITQPSQAPSPPFPGYFAQPNTAFPGSSSSIPYSTQASVGWASAPQGAPFPQGEKRSATAAPVSQQPPASLATSTLASGSGRPSVDPPAPPSFTPQATSKLGNSAAGTKAASNDAEDDDLSELLQLLTAGPKAPSKSSRAVPSSRTALSKPEGVRYTGSHPASLYPTAPSIPGLGAPLAPAYPPLLPGQSSTSSG